MTWNIGAGLEGKGVLVTGAAGGIGRAVAAAFAATGARVVAADLDQVATDRVAQALEGSGHVGLGLDLARSGAADVLVERAQEHIGPLYVLAHVAALLRRQSDLEEVTEEDWDLQHTVNLKATFFLCRAAARAMRRTGRGGRIITFASQSWWTGGFAGSVVYTASKGGVVSMSRGLARTYGPDDITVNTVAPGLVKTAMGTGGVSAEMDRLLVSGTPLGRWAEPEEVAGAVVFLASQHASFITGATINVSGGMLMY